MTYDLQVVCPHCDHEQKIKRQISETKKTELLYCEVCEKEFAVSFYFRVEPVIDVSKLKFKPNNGGNAEWYKN